MRKVLLLALSIFIVSIVLIISFSHLRFSSFMEGYVKDEGVTGNHKIVIKW